MKQKVIKLISRSMVILLLCTNILPINYLGKLDTVSAETIDNNNNIQTGVEIPKKPNVAKGINKITNSEKKDTVKTQKEEAKKELENSKNAKFKKETITLKVADESGKSSKENKKNLLKKLKKYNVSKVEPLFKVKKKNNSSVPSSTWYKATLKKNTDVVNTLEELLKEDYIISAEPDYVRELKEVEQPTITDPRSLEQHYLEKLGIKEAWNYLKEQNIPSGGKRDVVVAVIDTGVDYKHPDLSGNMWINTAEIVSNGIDDDKNGYVDDIYGASIQGGTKFGDPNDDNGHGTHVAGIIAASANNNIGGVGVAYNVKIMAIKAGQSSGIFSASDIATAIYYAADKGADVINMSYGGYGKSILEEDALQIAYGTSVLVAAAGNDGVPNEPVGNTPGKPMYPAAYPWVLGVMAESETPSANGDNLADFSNWDINPSNSVEYEVMAPGVSILSTLPGDRYAKWSGTSMSAPVVSGIAALVRSKFSDKNTYSSRFIMGQLASTGDLKQGITYSPKELPASYHEVNAYKALTSVPKPDLSYIESYIFDSKSIDPNNNENGVIDAGETIDIAAIIRNQWGKADNVQVKIDANSTAGIPDPYVSLVTDTVNYGAVGSFASDDNGLIYDASNTITGVSSPFKIKVASNTPNDHLIKLNVSITGKNGFDTEDASEYTSDGTVSLVVRHATEFPRVIDKDMTITKDNYWLISDKTLIESGVTVTVEPGAQIQFWSADPSDPYSEQQSPYLQVEGNLKIQGTATDPVDIFTGSFYEGYEIKISAVNEGKAEINYAKIANPVLDVTTMDHCYFYQDLDTFMFYKELGYDGKIRNIGYQEPKIKAENIKNSRFYKLGYRYGGYSVRYLNVIGKLDNNIFDSCILFSDYNGGQGSIKSAQNNVFLKNYRKSVTYGDTYYDGSQIKNWGIDLDTNYFMKSIFPVQYKDKTYFGLITPDYNFNDYDKMKLVEKFVNTMGGHIVTINDSDENQLLQDYTTNYIGNYTLLQNTYPNDYGRLFCEYPYIGYTDFEQKGTYKWISGEDNSYSNWQDGMPQNDNNQRIAQLLSYSGKWVNNYSQKNWNSGFIIEVSGTLSQSDIDDKIKKFINSQYVSDMYNTVKNNAILNNWSNPNVEQWMRFFSFGNRSKNNYLTNNYWGSASKQVIDKAIVDYNDDFNTAKIIYDPILTTAPETAYPFVVDAYVSTVAQEKASKVGAEKVTFHVKFNRDMDQNVQPQVSFGPDDPMTDYTVKGNWVDARNWEGTFDINPITGDGYQLIRVAGAVAADDPWLVTGNDEGRFKFEVLTSGAESMKLQANGAEGKIQLSWAQDDFPLLAGYNIYRSDSATGTYKKINSTIIPSEQSSYDDTDVLPGKTYYYKFTVLKTDLGESDFSNVASASPFDTITPVITHTPIKGANVGLPLQIFADISDNVGVKGASVYYRKAGTSDYNKIDMVKTTANRYSAVIDGANVNAPGVDYYIEATDGNSIARNGTASNPNNIVITDAPKITSISPTEGPDTGGTKVIISGSNFKQGAKVTFDGWPASNVVVESDSRITAVTPAHIPDTVDVAVINTGGYYDTVLRGFKYINTGVDVTIPDVQGNIGSTIEIPINISNVSGLTAADIKIAYDSELLSLESARTGNITTDFSLSLNKNTPGMGVLSMASSNTVNGSGTIAYLQFKVLNSTKTSSALTLEELNLNGGNIQVSKFDGTFTVSKTHSINGFIKYYYSNIPVSGFNVSATGGNPSSKYSSSSVEDGSFSIKDLPSGDFTLNASKSNNATDITSYDASLILQASAGLLDLNNNQRIAADVNNDGKIDSMDAAYVLKRAVGIINLPFPGVGKVWTTVEGEKKYTGLSSDLFNQDLTAILIGDVSGNWSSGTQATSQSIVDSQITFNSGRYTKNLDGSYSVPIKVKITDAELSSVDIVINYDNESVMPVAVDKTNLSSNFSIAYNTNTDGVIRISMAGSTPITTDGDLMIIKVTPLEGVSNPESITIKTVEVNENSVKSIIGESINEYTVSFNSQGGSTVESKIADYNTLITAPTSPTKVGYTFGGWYKDSVCITEWNFEVDKVTEDTTLYAKWSVIAPNIPQGLVAKSLGNSINLNWSSVTGASGYEIYRATSSTGTYTLLTSTTGLSYTNTGLTTNNTYYYKIRAYKLVGKTKVYSEYTDIVSAKPEISAPTNLEVKQLSNNSNSLTWSAVPGACGYEVYRSTSITGNYTLLGSTTALNYTNTGLTTNITYYYKIRAYKTVGNIKVYSSYTI